jgi:DNA polymerase I-like protein with 3'-5' exonuclease and polymerase domains
MKTLRSTSINIDTSLPYWLALGVSRDFAYNAMDSMVTHEIFDVMSQQLAPASVRTYGFERGMQAPALTMMLRGIRVDHVRRAQLTAQFEERRDLTEGLLRRLCREVYDTDLNHRSPAQLKQFFFSTIGLPEIHVYDHQKKERRVSTNREVLEKIEGAYYHAMPFAALILELRDADKKISVLKSGVDPDGRMRSSYNVASAKTGRWSSSQNVFGRGLNAQNVTDEMREMFIADPGKKLAYLDLEQAESKEVAYLSGDETYIAACMSGDLHTYVARLIWPHQPWTGDLDKDKDVAEQKCYRQFSFRDLAKRGGHATNYLVTPPTMSQHIKIPVQVAKDFQTAYYMEFPGIKRWQEDAPKRLAACPLLINPFGRPIWFFGRASDPATIREFVAAEPQSTIADCLNIGLYKLWMQMEVIEQKIEILAQVHDAVLIQYDEKKEDEIIPQALELLKVPHIVRGHELVIPTDAAVGWNWRKRKVLKDGTVENEYGLKKWKHGQPDTRKPPTYNLLDQRVCDTY